MALNVVALVSGGKDSMYSMLHCIDQGHRIVALANLYPPRAFTEEGDDKDLNSFMFQTAGHSIVPLYAKALDLPLYRREITGTAQHRPKDYTPTAVAGDETEAIFTLLSDVKKAHPDANAVSTGAILSTYQRTRVESVALRLGLTPLGYLWQYPGLPHAEASPEALLRHMGSVGIDARIIKVASGGLDDSFLWQNLCEERTIQRVQRAVGRFGGSVLGEGGEFETLVIKGPSSLWKGRLVISDEDRNVVKADGGESFLNFRSGSVEMITSAPAPGIPHIELYDDRTKLILSSTNLEEQDSEPAAVGDEGIQPFPQALLTTSLCSNGILYLNNIYGSPTTEGVAEQGKESCKILLDNLIEHGLDCSHILHTTILLRSMSDFGIFNTIYGKLFALPLPPSRVTVACGERLPSATQIVISVIASKAPTTRQGLHVQTRSHWAPANIGPYSQTRSLPCVSGHSFVYVAGQVPLVPASMDRFEPQAASPALNFMHSAALSLQHLWRIGTEQNIGCWTGAVAYLAPSADFHRRAGIARQLWMNAHRPSSSGDADEEEDVDVWDQRNLRAQVWIHAEDASRPLPDYERLSTENQHPSPADESPMSPGFFAVEVDALPRDCAIEWQSSGLVSHANKQKYIYMHESDPQGLYECRQVSTKNDSMADGVAHSQVIYCGISAEASKNPQTRNKIRQRLSYGHTTIYTSATFTYDAEWKSQVIPCRRIFGACGQELVAAIVVHDVVAS